MASASACLAESNVALAVARVSGAPGLIIPELPCSTASPSWVRRRERLSRLAAEKIFKLAFGDTDGAGDVMAVDERSSLGRERQLPLELARGVAHYVYTLR